MERDTMAQSVRRLLDHIDNKTTDSAPSVMRMPVSRYFDASVANAERQYIFSRSPFVAAHSSELPGVGDFITTEYVGIPLLVIRQADNSVAALVNVCRHRGGRVEFDKRGTRSQLICSYHGWCYGQDGKLKNISFPEGYPGTGSSDSSMTSLPVDERYGLIWVTPTPGDALSMASNLDHELNDDIIASGISTAVLCREYRWELGMNWKLVMDGFLDTQHLGFLHPQTVGPSFYPNVHVLDSFGKNTRLVVPRSTIKQARGKEADLKELRKHIGCNITVYPATIITIVPRHFEIWTISPHASDAAKCDVVLRFLVNDTSMSELEIQSREDDWSNLLNAISNEDWPMAQSIQDGLPRAYMAETLYGRNELPAQVYYKQIQRDLDASGDQ
jgi:phenylpropionate dioxygenase-like ring-hydroxylating dioxygenase large terminal subunit